VRTISVVAGKLTPQGELTVTVSLKMAPGQRRRCVAAAKKESLPFSVWARTVLVTCANRVMGEPPARSARLEAPALPGSR
jgi:hypothetical protein